MNWDRVVVAMMFAIVVFGRADGQSPQENSDRRIPAIAPGDYPQRPIKIVVPFGAGGGSDTFVRILQKGIEENDLLSQPIVIVNIPGAGGAIGSRQVMESEPDGYTLMCLHEAIITAKYAGSTEYGPEVFEPVAGTGDVGTVIAVAEDADYANLNELLSDAMARPEQVVFSANIGAPSHFAGLMLEAAKPGARFRYTQTGGGAKRFAALAGGHIDVSSFSFAEYMQFQPAGLRALAYCGEVRHPGAPDLPTASEQGFDVISSIMQFWWAPKNTSPEKIQFIADVLEESMRTGQVRERLDAIYTDPVFISGDELQDSLNEREKRIAGVAQRELTELPNFPVMVLGMVAMLSIVVVVQELKGANRAAGSLVASDPKQAAYPLQPGLAISAVVLTGIYILVMQMHWVDFRAATATFIFGLGLVLTRMSIKLLPWLAAVAIGLSLALHMIFTNVFAIALP